METLCANLQRDDEIQRFAGDHNEKVGLTQMSRICSARHDGLRVVVVAAAKGGDPWPWVAGVADPKMVGRFAGCCASALSGHAARDAGRLMRRRDFSRAYGRGRNDRRRPPPAQIAACAANAPGSSLGFWRQSGDRVMGAVS